MAEYSVQDVEADLDGLIDKAHSGEYVTIRHRGLVVVLEPVFGSPPESLAKQNNDLGKRGA